MRVDPLELGLWLTAGLWLAATLTRWRAFAAVPVLAERSARNHVGPVPRVSVIVTARDEAQRIEETLRRILAQRGIDLEPIVVDDRSTDGTPGILRAIAARDPRLRVVGISELPAGWIGKPHACREGARQATGEWLLFTDGDAWMAPDLVAQAVAAGRVSGADHVCLFPREAAPSLPGAATLVLIASSFTPLIARVNRDRRNAFVGVGAFNLVRADAYRAIGGHERLRFEIVDDVKLGVLLRRAGFRSRVFDASLGLEVHWAPTVRAFLRGVEKNMFALFDYRLWLAAAAILLPCALWAVALLGPLHGSGAGIAAGVAWASTILPALVAARRGGLGARAAIVSPLMLPVACAAIVRSAFQTLRRGGVRWRETFYPLDELRRGGVRWF